MKLSPKLAYIRNWGGKFITAIPDLMGAPMKILITGGNWLSR